MPRPPVEVADIIRAAGESFKQSQQWFTWLHFKVLNAVLRCRTAALGGHVDAFSTCVCVFKVRTVKEMTKSVFCVPIIVIMLTFQADRQIKPPDRDPPALRLTFGLMSTRARPRSSRNRKPDTLNPAPIGGRC